MFVESLQLGVYAAWRLGYIASYRIRWPDSETEYFSSDRISEQIRDLSVFRHVFLTFCALWNTVFNICNICSLRPFWTQRWGLYIAAIWKNPSFTRKFGKNKADYRRASFLWQVFVSPVILSCQLVDKRTYRKSFQSRAYKRTENRQRKIVTALGKVNLLKIY